MHSLIRSANPHFSLLLAGNAVSAFGNSLFLIGLMLYFTTELVSPLFLGLAQAGAFLPVVLLGYTGGHLADTVSRPRMLAATDILRGLALAGTALLLPGAEAAGGIAAFLLLLCLVVLMGAMQALFQPALISLVSQMERESSGTTDLLALRTAVNHLFSLGGQGLGGLLAVLLGFPLLMLINGAGFFLSGLSELLIPERRHGGGGAGGAKGETKEEAGRGDGDKAEGLAASSRRTVAAELLRLNRQGAGLDLFLLVQFSYPFLAVTLPFFLRYRLELSSGFLGFTLAALFAGSIGFALVRSRRSSASRAASKSTSTTAARSVYRTGILVGLCCLGAALLRPNFSWLVIPGALVLGAGMGSIYLHCIGFVARIGTPAATGRRHGVVESLSNGLIPVAYLAAGVTVELLPRGSAALPAAAGGLLLLFSLVRAAGLWKLSSRRATPL